MSHPIATIANEALGLLLDLRDEEDRLRLREQVVFGAIGLSWSRMSMAERDWHIATGSQAALSAIDAEFPRLKAQEIQRDRDEIRMRRALAMLAAENDTLRAEVARLTLSSERASDEWGD